MPKQIFDLIDLTVGEENNSNGSTSSAIDEIVANLNVTRPSPRDYGPVRAISISDDDVPMPKTVGAVTHPSNKAVSGRKVDYGPDGTAYYDGGSSSDSLTPASAPWQSSPDMEGYFNANPSPSKSVRAASMGEAIRSPSRQATGRGDIGDGNLQTSQANRQVLPIHTTPRKSDWTVDKIATALTACYSSVEQAHSQLVEFLFEGAENETWPDLRSTDSPDPFSGVSSCALDPAAPAPHEGPTTSIKIKVRTDSPLLRVEIVLTNLYSNIAVNMESRKEDKGEGLGILSRASSRTGSQFQNTHFTMWKSAKTY